MFIINYLSSPRTYYIYICASSMKHTSTWNVSFQIVAPRRAKLCRIIIVVNLLTEIYLKIYC